MELEYRLGDKAKIALRAKEQPPRLDPDRVARRRMQGLHLAGRGAMGQSALDARPVTTEVLFGHRIFDLDRYRYIG